MDRLLSRINAMHKVKTPFICTGKFGWWGILFFFIFLFLLEMYPDPVGYLKAIGEVLLLVLTGGPLGIILAIVKIFTLLFKNIAEFFVVVGFYLVFFPLFWFARLDNWIPALSDKLDIFEPVLGEKLPNNVKLSFLLFFDGDSGKENSMPSDIRFMFEPGAGASENVRNELVGVQLQVTYNKGPHGKVPYMYAVFITKGKENLWKSLKALKISGYNTESGSSTENGMVYGTVVLRGSGYHTNKSDVKRLVDNVVEVMQKL